MTEVSKSDWQAAMTHAATKASQDAAFRDLCLTSPRAALQAVATFPIPENLSIRFVDSRGANMTILLPPAVAAPGELAEHDLEAVSGGTVCIASCGVSCIATCLCMGVPTLTGL